EVSYAHLSVKKKEKLDALVQKFDDVFAKTSGQVGCITSEMCRVRLTNNVPITLRPYKATALDQQRIDKHVKILLENDVIRKSTSQYAFPVSIVAKRDESEKVKEGTAKAEDNLGRMIVDLRRLNQITADEHFPLPRIADIQDSLLGAKYFTTLDLAAAFHNVVIHPDDRHKIAFVTMNGHYEYNRLLFGWKSSPMIFQRILYGVLERHELTAYT